MGKFFLGLCLFYALAEVCTANSFKCYQCGPKGGGSYSTEQCEKDQIQVDCNSTAAAPMTCAKEHTKKTDGNEFEARGCVLKSVCEAGKKVCEGGKDGKEKLKIKECEVACCDTNLCNSALATSAEVAIIMMGILCILLLL